jgi:hypothetical protein
LHHIARLFPRDIPALESSFLYNLPLIYGLAFGGCQLKYQVLSSSRVKVLALTPRRSSSDFPYEQYPVLLPYIPLSVSEKRRMPYHAFAAEYPNMSDAQPSELLVAVPAPASIGVSVWGRWGDAEGVTMIFECDVKSAIVNAYNVCT